MRKWAEKEERGKGGPTGIVPFFFFLGFAFEFGFKFERYLEFLNLEPLTNKIKEQSNMHFSRLFL